MSFACPLSLVLVCAASLGLAPSALADDSKGATTAATSREATAQDPVAVAAALKRTDQAALKSLPQGQAGNDGTAIDVGRSSGGVATSDTGAGLAEVHGTTKGQSAGMAGAARDVNVKDQAAPPTPKPQASPRQLRKMNVDRVVASLAPAFQSCADASNKSAPASTAVLAVQVAPSGAVDGADVASSSGVSPDVLACVAREVRGAKFGAPGGVGAAVAVPVVFAATRAK